MGEMNAAMVPGVRGMMGPAVIVAEPDFRWWLLPPLPPFFPDDEVEEGFEPPDFVAEEEEVDSADLLEALDFDFAPAPNFGEDVGVDSDPERFIKDPGVTGAKADFGVFVLEETEGEELLDDGAEGRKVFGADFVDPVPRSGAAMAVSPPLPEATATELLF